MLDSVVQVNQGVVIEIDNGQEDIIFVSLPPRVCGAFMTRRQWMVWRSIGFQSYCTVPRYYSTRTRQRKTNDASSRKVRKGNDSYFLSAVLVQVLVQVNFLQYVP